MATGFDYKSATPEQKAAELDRIMGKKAARRALKKATKEAEAKVLAAHNPELVKELKARGIEVK